MGYSVSDNKIMLTRGDTAKISVTVKYKTTGDEYTPQEGDHIRFSFKKYVSDKNTIFEKDVPIDTMLLVIEPEDTKSLPFGPYVFDGQLTFKNGDVDTFIQNGILEITHEVS